MNRRHFLQSLVAVPALVTALVRPPKTKLPGFIGPSLCKCGKPMGAHRPFDLQEHYIRPAAKAMADAIDASFVKQYYAGNMADVPGFYPAWRADAAVRYEIREPQRRLVFSTLSNPEVW